MFGKGVNVEAGVHGKGRMLTLVLTANALVCSVGTAAMRLLAEAIATLLLLLILFMF